jgi:hypothetical protein
MELLLSSRILGAVEEREIYKAQQFGPLLGISAANKKA